MIIARGLGSALGGLPGFGALPIHSGTVAPAPGAGGGSTGTLCKETDAAGKCIEVISLDPFRPPAQNTRFMIRTMGDFFRIYLQQRLAAVQGTFENKLSSCIGGKTVNTACSGFTDSYRLLYPLGIIDILGVPFTADELLKVGEDGALVSTYVPTPEQRFEADALIYLSSQSELALTFGVDPNAVGTFENFAADFSSPEGRFMPEDADRNSRGMLGVLLKARGKSIQEFVGTPCRIVTQAMVQSFQADGLPAGFLQCRAGLFDAVGKLAGRWVTSIPGYSLNPIQPTQEELTGTNGLYNWYKRGGYLLNTAVANGQIMVIRRKLAYNTGFFKCDTGKIAAAFDNVPDEGHGWEVYITVGPSYTMRAKMSNRTAWESVKKTVGDLVSKAFKLMCAAQPIASALSQSQLLAETCVRADATTAAGKQAAGCTPAEIAAAAGTEPALSCQAKLKCTKGAPGCICTPVGGVEVAAIAASNVLLTQICGPSTAAPSCSELVAPPPTPKKIWPWILGGLAIVGGAYAYSRR